MMRPFSYCRSSVSLPSSHKFCIQQLFEIRFQSWYNKNRRTIATTTHRDDRSTRTPLDGVKVLDLSRILAGPFASMLLGDYGATVWKVERPIVGDDTRTWGPPFDPVSEEQSAYFLAVNRNKKSIGIDIKKPDGLRAVLDMARKADVLIENFPPGKAEKLGLGYEKLKMENSRLIYCSITGYGPDGPLADKLAYDVMVSARCGLMGITGEEEGPPVKPGVALIDICTGLLAHGAISAALFSREKDGRGQKIDTSLFETGVSCLANVASSYLIAGSPGRRTGTAHTSVVPYQAFRSIDGYIVLGALNDKQFQSFASYVLGIPELAQDERFHTNAKRVQNRKELISIIEEKIVTKSNKEWTEICDGADVPCGPINNIKDVFEDPQIEHRKMVERVEHPTAGPISLVGIPAKFPDNPLSIRMPPPILGEHTTEVLKYELGYTNRKIENLFNCGAIYQQKVGT